MSLRAPAFSLQCCKERGGVDVLHNCVLLAAISLQCCLDKLEPRCERTKLYNTEDTIKNISATLPFTCTFSNITLPLKNASVQDFVVKFHLSGNENGMLMFLDSFNQKCCTHISPNTKVDAFVRSFVRAVGVKTMFYTFVSKFFPNLPVKY